jgi:hypothetical protein
MLKRLTDLWRGRRVETVGELRDFLASEAAHLSQKATIDYCRARSGLGWQKLVSEPQFVAALEACRWQAMAAVLADLVVVTEAWLRPCADDAAPRLAAALTAIFAAILDSSPAPDAARADWQGLPDELAARLARAQMGPVHNPGEVAKTSAARVFDLLPIHPSVRVNDREMVVNSVRFGMVAFSETLARAVRDPASLSRRLIAPAS